MGDRLEDEHWAHEGHQRKNVHKLLELCSEDLVSIAAVWKPDQLLLEASVCGKPCAKDELLSVEIENQYNLDSCNEFLHVLACQEP